MTKVVKRAINGVVVEHTIDGISQLGLGDIVASVATPIARRLRLKCIDKATGRPKPESRCDNWRKKLNGD